MLAIILFILNISFSKDPVLPVYQSILKQGDKLYQAGDYTNAQLMYEKYYQKYSESKVAKLIADCYWNNGSFDKALVYLEQSKEQSAESEFRKAEIYARQGKYALASSTLDALLKTDGLKEKEIHSLRKKGYDAIVNFTRDSSDWRLRYLAVNSSANERSPVVYNNELYIVSNRIGDVILPNASAFHYLYRLGLVSDLSYRKNVFDGNDKMKYKQAFLPDVSLRSATDSKTLLPGIHSGKISFNGTAVEKINGVFGKASMTNDGTIYFSHLFIDKPSDKPVYKICRRNSNGKIDVVAINLEQSSAVHPFITADEKYLYFSSDRAGGKGGFDIYYSINENGNWSEPVNLEHVNSPLDETDPYIFNDQIYFSSNGWPGLGGADIFVAPLNKSQVPVNLGYPLNSSKDEFDICFWKKDLGFISSNRYGGDDVFQFDFNAASVKIKSFLINSKTGLRMPNIKVVLEQQDEKGNWLVLDSLTTDHTGNIVFSIKPNREHLRLKVNADGYKQALQLFNTQGVEFSKEIPKLSLEPLQ